jgi:hypothetical protein
MLGLIEQMFCSSYYPRGIELCSVNLPLIFTPLALIAGFANTKSIAYFKGLISLLSLLSLNLIFQGFTMSKPP